MISAYHINQGVTTVAKEFIKEHACSFLFSNLVELFLKQKLILPMTGEDETENPQTIMHVEFGVYRPHCCGTNLNTAYAAPVPFHHFLVHRHTTASVQSCNCQCVYTTASAVDKVNILATQAK